MAHRVSICGAVLLLTVVCDFAPAADNSPPASTASARSSTAAESPGVRAGNPSKYIDELIRQGWADHDLKPSPPASDGEWCRRLYLDVLGRVPSVDELNLFLKEPPSERKARLVGRLLSDEYTEEYARNWSNIWQTILIGRPSPNEDRTLVDRPGMQKFLRDSFAANKPYDRMVYELLTATGVNKPGEKDFNGAVNFLIGNLADEGVNATAKTAKVFLGLQVQCTQCHNHPFNEWKQNQFWELNAFFRQARAERLQRGRVKGEAQLGELADRNFRGESNNPTEAISFYELRNGQLKSAFPVFVDGQAIDPSGQLSDVNRRKKLAELVVGSSYLPRAMVNRMWGHFLGYGFTKPIDDMGPNHPPTHPELLERLSTDFAGSGFDLKQLIRWIVLSEPYGLSSKMVAGKNERDDPSLGEPPMFSHFYLRQMRAEELYESLLVATEAEKTSGNLEEQERVKNDWLRQFTIAFGTDEGDDTTTFNGTIPQSLMMFNGDLIRRATKADDGSFLDRVSKNSKLTNPAKINYLFMAALARRPDKDEIDWANKLLAARKGDPVGALQDVFWVVLNTGEFILNH